MTIDFYAGHVGGHPFSENEELETIEEIQARAQSLANAWGTKVVAVEEGDPEWICWAEPETEEEAE